MIERREVTNAVLAMLTAATGMPVGRGRLPQNPGTRYYVVHALDATLSGPPLADLNEDLTVIFQVDSVSAPDPTKPGSSGSAEQAEWLADRARAAFLGRSRLSGQWTHPISVSGAVVMARSLDSEPGGTNDPADAIMNFVQRFRLDLTPA
ncbi:hypothetical protein [Streptomyces sp. NPDC047981]|uniref:hypothetical protein n=1 Tax=Streptomyces sp. NPDC047981 TaxID=3154610 RepID=UPI00342D60C9